MTIIVSDHGFSPDNWTGQFRSWEHVESDTGKIERGNALDVPNFLDGDELVPVFSRVALIRIPFPAHVDGRGFSLARRLRRLGFGGRLRAKGHILADQFVFARRCGFDEVEIDDDLARRQPEEVWLPRTGWMDNNYQRRLTDSP